MNADSALKRIISELFSRGVHLETRNHAVYSLYDLPPIIFDKFPLVTYRKTAWRKALLEMQWFLSGNPKCPADVQDWWDGQLSDDSCYYYGYPTQFRKRYFQDESFDPIFNLIDGIKEHPYSRRHILSTWDGYEMSKITLANNNNNTPTTCHGTLIQFFVRHHRLSMKHYQRSADVLLGLPHNWVQYWALLTWVSRLTGLDVGEMIWVLGDAHLYDEPSHIEVAKQIDEAEERDVSVELSYHSCSETFLADDFVVNGKIKEPLNTIRPVRL